MYMYYALEILGLGYDFKLSGLLYLQSYWNYIYLES